MEKVGEIFTAADPRANFCNRPCNPASLSAQLWGHDGTHKRTALHARREHAGSKPSNCGCNWA